MPRWRLGKGHGESRYTREGKILTPTTQEEFTQGMETGHFVDLSHKAYCILLYYTGIRKNEARRLIKEQFKLTPKTLLVDVFFAVQQTRRIKQPDGKIERIPTGQIIYERLKHSKRTPPIPIPLKAPYADILVKVVSEAKQGQPVFNFSSRTAYNIVRRVYKYPHLFRLSRITWFLQPHPEAGRPAGFSTAEVLSWTGLTINALNSYIGAVGIERMGKSLT